MDEDQILRSIIADPQLTDPSIDVGQLRQTTPTRTELLADVPEFSGLKYDPTQRSYVEDLYALYGGGAPMLPEPVVDTPVVDTTPIVDTSVMDQPAGDSILDTAPTVTTPTITTPTITQPAGGGADMATVPATTVTTPIDTSIAIEDLTQPSNVGDFQITAASPLTNQTGVIPEAPVINPNLETQGPITIEGSLIPGDIPGVNPVDEVALTGIETPEQQESFLQNVLGRAGQTVEGALNELGKIPGAIVDFTNQTVDVFGQKLNVGKTLAGAFINKIAGGPVSLIFDLLPEDSLENTTTRNIVDELKAEKDYGFNIQSGNLNQDPFGRNPVSAFGDYEQTLLDDIAGVNQSGFQTAEMREKKKEFAQDYFDKKAAKTAPQEDVGSVPGGEAALDETSSSEDIAQDFASKQTEAESRGGNIVDEFGSDGDTGRTTGPTVSLSDPDFGQFGRRQSATAAGGGNDPGGSKSKIVCTMMNESYGFGSFRNKIWMKFHKDLSPEYQKGYHKLFLPLIKISKKNIIVKKILEHIAVHSTIDMRQSMRGKTHLLGRIYRKILLPLCYWVGRHG